MNKSRNCSLRVEHKKTDYSERTSTHSFQHRFLILHEFQDYLLKSINLYALYMLYSEADLRLLQHPRWSTL